MTWRERGRGALVLAGAAIAAVALAVPASAGAAPKFPDLRPQPAADLLLSTALLNGENHYIIRFSSYMANAGEGPMELHGSPRLPPNTNFDPNRPLSGDTFDVDQFVYDDAGVEMHRIGVFYFHQAPGHDHFHFEDFARYELWTKRAYERAAANGFSSGQPLVKSKKISFCLQDSAPVADNAAAVPTYRTVPCSPVMQGISVGWADLYDWTLDDQWVDVGTHALADGTYVLRIVGDPTNKIYESPGKADPARESEPANTSARYFTIVDGRLAP